MKPWLVVEDEEDIRNIVKVMFGAWGHEALEFRDGNETWKWLDNIESGSHEGRLPELALLDIRMPGHKGHEIARRMRDLDPFQQIPIVLMTAFSLTESERHEMLNNCGVDRIINKPLPDFLELKRLLDELRQQKETQTASDSGASAKPDGTPSPNTGTGHADVRPHPAGANGPRPSQPKTPTH